MFGLMLCEVTQDLKFSLSPLLFIVLLRHKTGVITSNKGLLFVTNWVKRNLQG